MVFFYFQVTIIYPQRDTIWSNDKDLGITIVKNAVSKDRFQMLKNCIDFIDNSEAENSTDYRRPRFQNQATYITMFQKSFRKFGIFEENLAVDEIIVCYYGHNSLIY